MGVREREGHGNGHWRRYATKKPARHSLARTVGQPDSKRPGAVGYLFLLCLILTCLVLPRQAVAQEFDGLPKLTLDDNYSVEEGGVVTVTATMRNGPLNQPADFYWYTQLVSSGLRPATADDFTHTPSALDDALLITIPAGEESASWQIATTEDTIQEQAEYFYVRIAPRGPLREGSFRGDPFVFERAFVEIVDDDDPNRPSLADAEGKEGEGIPFTITIPTARQTDLVLRWGTRSLTGSSAATADVDYRDFPRSFSNLVTITAGQTQVTFTVSTLEDSQIEGDETFEVVLYDATGGALNITATATIDDDDGDPIVLSFTEREVTVNEGETAEVTMQLGREVDLETGDVLRITWITTVDGTSNPASDTDYESATIFRPGRVTIRSGVTEYLIQVDTTEDALVEGNEEFIVDVTSGSLPPRLRSVDIVFPEFNPTVTIIDDDQALVSLSPAELTVTEGGSSIFTYTVSLSAEVDEAVTVNWATESTGTNPATVSGVGSDLGQNQDTGTVTFTSNDTTNKTFSIAVTDDTEDEPDETFTVTLAQDDDNPLPSGVEIDSNKGSSVATIVDNDERVSIGNASAVENAAGGAVDFTVSLSAAVNSDVVLDVAYATGDTDPATLAGDLGSDRPATVTIDRGDLSATLRVPIINDDIVESNETFTVTLTENSVPTEVMVSTTGGSAIGTITNDDEALVSLSPDILTADEDGSFAYTINLDAPVDEAISITWTATAGSGDSAVVNDDLDQQTDTVEIAAGALQADFNIPINNDLLVEDNETFTVTISADSNNPLPAGVQVDGNNNSSTATITDNDEGIVVSIGAISEAEDTGDGNLTFPLTLSAAVNTEVTVTYSTADDTATVAGSDYTAVTGGTVTIAANVQGGEIDIEINDDDIVEGDETLTVTLTAVTRTDNGTATVSDTADSATGTITNDDEALVSLSPDTLTAGENGSFAYTVNLDAVVDEAISITWTATAESGDSAVVNDDLDQQTDTVEIAAGTLQAGFNIPINNDLLVEDNETFTVTISADSNNPLPAGVQVDGNNNSSAAIITDDDVGIEVSIAAVSEAEDTGDGNLTFPLTLSATVNTAVTVTYRTADDTATAGSDYTAVTNGSVTIPANVQRGEINIAISDDQIVESSETLTVMLTAVTRADTGTVTISTEDSATGTITDNDTAEVSISPTSASVEEGETFTFTVSLSAQVDQAVTVNWATESTGTNPAMVSGAESDLGQNQDTGTVTFQANNTTDQEFTIATNEDTSVEADETFTVTIEEDSISSLPDRVEIGTSSTATATIGNDDQTTFVSFRNPLGGLAAINVDEGDTLSIQVRGYDGALGPRSVPADVTLAWTATPDNSSGFDPGEPEEDLGEQNGTVTILAGTDLATLTIPITNDEEDEPIEQIRIALSVPDDTPLPGGVTLLAEDRLDHVGGVERLVRIQVDEDDAPPSPTVSIADMEVDENVASGSVDFTVSLTTAVDSDVVLNVAYAGGVTNPATPVDDLGNNPPTTVTINQGQTRATLTVPVADDEVVEGNETFTVTLTVNTAPDGVIIGTGVATGTITDNDTAQVTLSPSTLEATEGNSFTYTVRLSAPADEAVNLTWTASIEAGNTADLAADLETTTNTVSFAANDNEDKTFTIATTQNTENEPNKTFTVTLTRTGTLPTGVEIDTTRNTSVATIVDDGDDDGTARFSLSVDQVSADEGGDFTFTVSLSDPVSSRVSVDWTAAGKGTDPATLSGEGSDLEADQQDTGRLIFEANNNTAQTFTIRTRDDGNAEEDEIFMVTLSDAVDASSRTAVEGLRIGSPSTVTVTIRNDDGPPSSGLAEVSLLVPATFRLSDDLDGEGLLEFHVEKDGNIAGLQQAVTFTYSTVAVTALEGVDYTKVTNQTVNIPGSASGGLVTVDVSPDQIVEEDETFTIDFISTTPGVGFVNGVVKTEVTIVDQDVALIAVSDASASEGGGTINFPVFLTNQSNQRNSVSVSRDILVDWNVTSGSADVDTDLDLEESSGTVTILAGATSAMIEIPINDDNEDEADIENFTVTLSEPRGLGGIDASRVRLSRLPGSATATGTITDDDVATVVSIGAISEAEDTGDGNLTFPLALSAAVNTAITVTYSTEDGTATVAGSDYTAAEDSTVIIAAGAQTGEINIAINDDDIVEGNETLTVTLTAVTRADNGTATVSTTAGSAAGTITNDDAAVVSIEDATAVENVSGGNIGFTVSLDNAVSSDVVLSVAYAIGDTDSVTLAVDLGRLPSTVTITEGQTSATLNVPITDDEIVEGDETFTVTISEDSINSPLPVGVEVDSNNDNATGTITENDEGVVTLSPSTLAATEGNSFTYTVSLSAPVDEAVNLTWTASIEPGNTATLATDLQTTTNTVTFAANDNTDQTFTIATTEDTNNEPDKTFTVTLTRTGTLPDGVEIDTNENSSVATIVDDDESTGSVVVSIDDASFNEGDGTVTLTASLSEPVGQDTVLRITYQDGTATVSEDLSGSPPADRSVTILANTLSADFTLSIRDDGRAESTETFSVFLGVSGDDLPPGVNFDLSDNSATITIIDNDEPTSATVSIADANPVVERIGNINFRVSISSAATSDVVLGVTYGGGTDNPATPDDDLGSNRPTTVTIEEGDFGTPLSVPIADDSITEGDETFTVSLTLPDSNPVGLELSLGKGQATGTIVDDDGAVVSIEGASAVENVSSGTLDFTVSLSRAVTRDVVLNVAYAAGDTNPVTLADDLGTPPTTVRIDRGDLSTTLRVPINNDNLVEGNETFTATLTVNTAPTGVIIGTGVATGTITDDDAAQVTLSPATLQANEGNSFTYTVSLSAEVDEAVNLTWTASTESGDNATVADDLQTTTNTVTFPAGQNTAQTFTIATTQDSEDEPNETFTVTLRPTSTLPDGVEINTNQNSSVSTIVDDDDDPSSVAVSIADAIFSEGDGTVTLTASLSSPVNQDTEFRIIYQDGTATVSEDLSGDPPSDRSVTILEGELSADFTVSIRDDIRTEPTETFSVFLGVTPSDLPPGVDFDLTNNSATVTIIDNDQLPATVSIVSANPVAEGIGNVDFRVNLTRAVNSDVVLNVAYGGGDTNPATPDDDLGSNRPTTVTIERGDVSATLTVPITNDDLVEDDETFTVTLTGNTVPTEVSIATATATGTITNDDEALVSLSPDILTADEDGSFAYTVNLDAPVDEAISIIWTATAESGDSAVVNDDLDQQTDTVEIAAGALQAGFNIPIDDDLLVEDNETFTVTISADQDNPLPAGVQVDGNNNSSAATITDNDIATVVSIGAITEAEDTGDGNLTFPLRLSASVDTEVTVTYSTEDGTATVAGNDYTPVTGGTATIAANALVGEINITINNDQIVEGNETLTVTLTAVTRADNGTVAVSDTDGSATGTITNDDEALVSIGDATAVENVSGGNIGFTVSLDKAASSDVVLNVAYGVRTGNPVTLATDLGTLPSTVTIEDGETSATLTVPVTDDNLVEGDETFTVTLTVNTAPTGVTVSDTEGSATGTITNDDVATVVSIGAVSEAEGTGNLTFPLTLSAAVNTAITVTYSTADGTATVAGSDYTAVTSGTVEIAANAQGGEIDIAINDDDIVESSETLTVTLTAVTRADNGTATVHATEGSATGTITDDDTAVVTLSPSTLAATEGNSFTYTVSLSAPVDEAVNLTWTASIEAGNTADLAADLQTTTNTVTFAANDNADKTFTIATTQDTANELNETFTVTLTRTGTLPTGVEIDTTRNTSASTIVDDDEPTGSVVVSIDDASFNEGDGTVTLTASLSEPVGQDTVLRITYQDGTATVSEDLSGSPPADRSVTILANTLSADFTLSIRDDGRAESTETFSVFLGVSGDDLPPGVNFDLSDNSATITIIDNDEPTSATVSIADANPVVERIGNINFRVSISSAATSDVVLGVTYGGGTDNPATPDDDLGSNRPTTVTIEEGDFGTPLSVPIADDSITEGDETFTVSLTLPDSNPVGLELSLGKGQATGTIVDDDGALVSIEGASAVENVAGGTLDFTVSLSRAVTRDVVLDVAYAAGDTNPVTLADDLGTPPTTVRIDRGDLSTTLRVPINNDNLVEGNETFTATLTVNTAPTGVIIGTGVAGIATGTITDDDAAQVTLSPATLQANEGNSFTYTASLSAEVDEAVNLTWTASTESGDNATVADDLQTTTNTVTFAANDNTDQTFTIATTQDSEDEPNETFTVTLRPTSTLPDGVEIDTNQNSSVSTIVDDDDDPSSVAISIADAIFSEGDGTVTLTASLSSPVNQDTEFRIIYQDGTATVSEDLSGDPPSDRSVTILEGELSADFTVSIRDDIRTEPTETFSVFLGVTPSDLPPGVDFDLTNNSATVTIIDNDQLPATVSIVSANPVAEGIGNVDFRVNLTRAVNSDVVLNVAYGGGDTNPATPAEDLGSDRPTTVTIDRGDVSATLTVPITNDNLVEDDETFTVTLTGNTVPTEVSIATATATGTITNDDEALVSLSPDILTADEDGSFAYTVNLDAPVDEAISIIWTATAESGDSAVVNDDLDQQTDTVEIAAGTLQAGFNIPIDDDLLVEDDETFTVTIRADSNNPLPAGVQVDGNNNSSAATITDNDIATVVSIGAITEAENTGDGNLTFPLTLSQAVDTVVTVTYSTEDGTATVAGNDYTAVTGGTVEIAANTTQTEINIAINNDAIAEGNETLTVTLTAVTRADNGTATISDTEGSAVGTITNDDVATVVSIGAITEAENTGDGNLTFPLTLSQAVDTVVTVTYSTEDGTATVAGNDYTAVTGGTVEIAANTTQAEINIAINNDAIAEGNETLTVTLTAVTRADSGTATVSTSAGSAVGTITNDDVETVVSIGAITEAEDTGDGNLTFPLTLSEAVDTVVTVTYSTEDGTATVAGSDYTPVTSGTAIIAANALTGEINITINDDQIVEGSETLTVRLTAVTRADNGTVAVSDTADSATGMITNDDEAVVSIEDATAVENVSGGNIGFTVSLDKAASSDVVLNVAYGVRTGNPVTLATDLGTLPSTVTIEDGETSATLTVPVTDDNLVEGDETFTVTISQDDDSPLPTGVTISDTEGSATGTITDDDAAVVTLSPSTLAATEGNSFTYTVRLSAPVDEAVNLTWTASIEPGNSATLATDLQTTTNTVTFAANDNEDKTFTIATTQDTANELNETFTVTLTRTGTLPTGVEIDTNQDSSVATIVDDDEPTGSVVVSIDDASFNEGDGTVTLTASLSEPVGQDTVLRITYQDGTATVSEDLSGSPPADRSVTILANTLSADFTLSIRDDGRAESTETFSVFLGVSGDDLPPGVNFDLSDNSATITIIDNDEPTSATVSIADANPVVERIGNINFRVSISSAATSDVVLGVTYGGGTDNPATPDDDLGSNRPTTVTIEEGDFGTPLSVPIADDSITEGDETFTVSLTLPDSNPVGLELSLGKGQATGTIVDDDGAVVSIEGASAVENVSSGTLDFTVSLSRAVTRDVVLNVAYAAGDTNPVTLADDLGTPPTTVRIDRGDLSTTLRVPINNDNLVEGNETFTATLTVNTAPTGVIIGTGVATGTITDDDAAQVTLSPATLQANEGNSFTYTVSLSAEVDEAVNLTWTASTESGDNATVADDLQTTTNTVTFPAGQNTAQTFTIATTQDSEDEPNETFTVTLRPTSTLPDGVEINTNQNSSVSTIVDDDDDPSSVAVSIADAIFSEGDGTVTLTASLSSPVNQDTEFRIIYQDGTATVSEDLSGDPPSDRSVTILEGELSADFTVSIRDDIRTEPTETFSVFLGVTPSDLPPGVDFDLTNNSATVTIIDNDQLPATVSIVSANPVAEGIGNVDFRVNLTRAVNSDVVLNVAYGGGDTNPATPDDDLGSNRPTTVTIERGDVSATLTVPITNDDLVEDDETFTVTLTGNTVPTEVSIATATATGTITNDDEALVSLSPDILTADEDGSFAYTVNLDAPVDEAISIIWTATAESGDSAVVNDDLDQQTDTVEIAAGALQAGFNIPIDDDLLVEDNETFTVTISADQDNPLPAGVQVDGNNNSSAATITDNDIATVVSIGAITEAEDTGDGNLTFPLRLSASVDTEVTVTYSTEDGTATVAGNDYTPVTGGTATIAANALVGEINITINNDQIVEGNETLTVTLTAVTRADNGTVAVSDTDGSATGTITNDDEALVSIGDATAVENVSGGNIGFTVSLDKAASSDVVLNVAYGVRTGNPVTLATDLGTLPSTVTIEDGETSATLTVPVTDDNLVEGDETFTVTLTENTVPTGVTISDTGGSATGTITDNDEALVSIADAEAVAENGTAEFTVSLGQEAATNVVLNVAYGGGTNNPATPTDDLGSGRPTTVTIDQGETSATLMVPITNDNLVEGNETFTVTLTVNSAPTGVTVSTSAGSATGTITDNDEALVSIENASAVENVAGGSISFPVSLSQAAATDVVLNVAYGGGTNNPATPADDLGIDRPTTVTIDQGETSANLRVPITNDNLVEGNETFTVTLTVNSVPTGVTIGTGVATGTITDDDEALVSIADAVAVAENGTAEFTVSLSQEAATDVVLNVVYGGGTNNPAMPAADLDSGRPTTVTIDQGETSTTLMVPITNDDIVEGNETFTVTLTLNTAPTGVRVSTSAGSATGTITDNDEAVVSIEDATAVENVSGGNMGFTVRLSRAASSDVVLNVAYGVRTGNPVTLANDLGTLLSTVTITEGQTSATLMVPVTNDDIVEGNETFTVTLTLNTAPTGVTVSTTAGSATGTITDNDEAMVNIADALAVAENGTAEFTVSLSQVAATNVVLNVAYGGGVTNPATPAADLGSGRPTTVTIDQGDLSATLRVPVTNDNLVEGNETFTVTLTVNTAPDGVTIGTGVATGTITDNDEAMVNIANALAVAENGTAEFTVSLSRAAATDVVLNVAYGGGTSNPATPAADLGSGRPTTVTIDQGRTSATLMVPINNDNLVEGNETFTVTLTVNTAPDGVSIGTGVATGTITDNDEAMVNITDAEAVAENGTAEFTVSLSQTAATNVVLNVAYGGGVTNPATPATDLASGRPTTVTIDQGRTSTTLMVPIANDAIVEEDETFTVTLTVNTAPTGVTIGTGVATGTITNDDEGVVSIENATAVENVAGGSVGFTVSLSQAAAIDVVLNVGYRGGVTNPATPADDLGSDRPTTVTIDRGETSATLRVPITNDNLVEGSETFTVTLTENTAPTGVTIGTVVATGTITDDDAALVNIANAVAVAENGTAEFTVSLSRAAAIDVVLNVAYRGGVTSPATPADDLGSGRPTTVTIDQGSTSATLRVPINNDNLVEGNETFTVTLTENTAPDGVTIGTGVATGTITDNDEAVVNIANAVAVAENGTAEFTVSLSRAAAIDVVLNVAYRGGATNPATPADDLGSGRPTTVTIDRGETSATLRVPTTNDNIVEGNETFTVTLTENTAPTGVTIGTGVATGIITDDDEAMVNISDATAAAEDDMAIFLISLNRAVADNVVLAVTYESDTATIADDLQSNPPATVTITANRTTATLSVPINDDDIVEGNETFTVILGVPNGSSLPTGVTISGARATGTITDNDSSVVSIAPVASPDGQSLVFTVALSNPVAEDMVLTWTATVDSGSSAAEVTNGASGTAEVRGTASNLAENGETSGTVTIIAGSRSARFRVDTTGLSAGQTVTVTLSETGLLDGVTLSQTANRATGTVLVIQESELIDPRRSGALSALRHHISHFERITSTAVHNRLDGSGHGNGFGLSENLGSGNVVRGAASDDHRWGAWINTSFVGFDGDSTGRQADIYTGIDYLSDSGNVVIGTLLGIESANLEVGEADYESEFVQLGVYGGVRLAENLIWDGAIGYGTSDPIVRQGDLFATYDAQRITVRNQLTGSYDLLSSGRLRLSPQLGMLYARERISDFTDSVGNTGGREVLEIGRISAGPRLTWEPRQGREVEFGVRLHWDVLNSESGRERDVSGSADLGIRFPMTSKVKMGIFLEADGLGITDEFATYGGRIEIRSTY